VCGELNVTALLVLQVGEVKFVVSSENVGAKPKEVITQSSGRQFNETCFWNKIVSPGKL
jgi:hypothetical protein